MLFADRALAQRIEELEANGILECTHAVERLDASGKVPEMRFAGGRAAFLGTDTHFSRTMGAGLHGLVTAEELDQLEIFFRDRGAPVVLDLCPFADRSLWALLSQRGYHPTGFKNILARPVRPNEKFPKPPEDISIAEVTEDNIERHAQLLARGFLDSGKPPPARMVREFEVILSSDTLCFTATRGGSIAGLACMGTHRGVAAIICACTLPHQRRHGIHTALLQARLRRAAELGCDLAKITMTNLGGTSQRNAERLGFQIVYTRVEMTRRWG